MSEGKKQIALDGGLIHWSFFFRLLLLALGVVAAAFLIWNLTHLLLLAFGAVLFGMLIRALADAFSRHTPLPTTPSLIASTIVIIAAVIGFGMLLGSQIQTQFSELIERLPDLVQMIAGRFGIDNPQDTLMREIEEAVSQASFLSNFAGISSTALGIVSDLVIVFVAGIYLAADPGIYRRGLLLLFPRSNRQEARDTLEVVGASLRLWLLGQLLGMLLVGALSAAGLWLLGVPSALALGLIAALFEFIPILGPILGAIPAILTGFAESPATALWVIGLYVLIQQIEGNLITPMIQQRMVKVPPALTIFAVVGFALLLGPLGAVFAMPLLVVVFVTVKKLWIRETLDEDVSLPGDEAETAPARAEQA
ncbi:putative PurR-regulated permease PerM [Pseudorhizobium tarimense]|uniref:PurR-regulated permease PerM n=1 Tax=Pseudorhizobium tarimense TaxID=1079109 RepID=A0ABV2HDW3_9HYPH|nr:AI-2E family transporter [Pseudorhizobium tarimense]MCJ8521683.1 AI-2E family transporter [Pseudorhizobium tarimense]